MHCLQIHTENWHRLDQYNRDSMFCFIISFPCHTTINLCLIEFRLSQSKSTFNELIVFRSKRVHKQTNNNHDTLFTDAHTVVLGTLGKLTGDSANVAQTMSVYRPIGWSVTLYNEFVVSLVFVSVFCRDDTNYYCVIGTSLIGISHFQTCASTVVLVVETFNGMILQSSCLATMKSDDCCSSVGAELLSSSSPFSLNAIS